jgi:hypothetical protein
MKKDFPTKLWELLIFLSVSIISALKYILYFFPGTMQEEKVTNIQKMEMLIMEKEENTQILYFIIIISVSIIILILIVITLGIISYKLWKQLKQKQVDEIYDYPVFTRRNNITQNQENNDVDNSLYESTYQ